MKNYYPAVLPSVFATLPLLLITNSAPAASVVVDSYSYLTSPHSSYPDSGGELTDGITYSKAWTVPSTTITSGDVTGLTGWLSTNPGIRFNFAQSSLVNSVTVWAADSDGSAGVGLPSAITIRTPDNSFVRNFFITNPAGNGSTVPLILNGFEVNSPSLIVEAQHVQSWTMFSEIEFSSIPEPSAWAMTTLLIFGTLLRRRRQ